MPDEIPTDRTQKQLVSPTVSAQSALGFPAIPGYDILREIGRGGMGAVLKGANVHSGHPAAVKVMLPGEDRAVANSSFEPARRGCKVRGNELVTIATFSHFL